MLVGFSACLIFFACTVRSASDEQTVWAAVHDKPTAGIPLTSTVAPEVGEPTQAQGVSRGGPTMTPAPARKATSTTTQTSQERLPSQDCSARFGRLEHDRLTADYLPVPMNVRVYLPPCYDKQLDARYPVLYLIHGQNFTEDQWDRIGADETADRLISARQVTPFIIVMPLDALLRDPESSPFQQAFIELLVPWVDKNYRTISDRDHRAIGGLSRGGAWALYLGLSHADLFSVIGMHSSFFFNGEQYPTQKWLQDIPPDEFPRLFLDIGAEDHLLQANHQLQMLLLANDIPFEAYLFPGRHEESYWSSHLEQYLRWYTREW